MNLAERARAVRTREELIAFVKALVVDYRSNREAWANPDIESFLAAMAAWAEDMDGFYRESEEDPLALPPWRVVADMLMAARIYE